MPKTSLCARRSPGVGIGEKPMTAATMATLVEFPDRTLLGEDVDLERDARRWHAVVPSYLCQLPPISVTDFSAKHQAVRSRTYAMADCYAKDNQISDEWLVRDNGAIVRGVGVGSQGMGARKDHGWQSHAVYTLRLTSTARTWGAEMTTNGAQHLAAI